MLYCPGHPTVELRIACLGAGKTMHITCLQKNFNRKTSLLISAQYKSAQSS